MEPLVLNWPGGEHSFRLGIAELEAVQQNTDCGPEHLLNRINAGQWYLSDLMQVLRLGLIGGGMPHVQALKVIRNAFEQNPGIEFKVPAQAVLAHCLYGPPEDQPGEPMPVQPTPGD